MPSPFYFLIETEIPMTTLVQLVRGTEAVRDRAEAANGYVNIENSRYAAGTKTLMVSATIDSESKANARYSAVVVFQGVESADKKQGRYALPFKVGGRTVFVEKPKASGHDVRVRCGCTDYTHTWAWYNNQSNALFGKKFPPYSRKTKDMPERNKAHQAGMCKHLIALTETLRDSGVVRR